MRTTLNLDDDVATRVRQLAGAEGRSVSRIVNDILRAGLRARQQSAPPPAYDPPTFSTGQHLVDVTDVAGALEVLDGAR
jgi:hypothetical protein